jgi:hypothetical protein
MQLQTLAQAQIPVSLLLKRWKSFLSAATTTLTLISNIENHRIIPTKKPKTAEQSAVFGLFFYIIFFNSFRWD